MKTASDTNKTPSITGITCDSRKVKPGYAFIAIEGFNEDGHKYIEEAIANGAKLIFTEKDISTTRQAKIIKVDNTRSLLGQLASEFYHNPSQKINVIGVTGTNGKTTTTHLIYNLLNYNQKQTGLIGTVKVDNGQNTLEGKLTTPPPVLLQKYLSQMVDNNLNYACMEVSSHGIKLERIKGTRFAVKVGTNISTDHYDLHANFKEYLKVKKSFLKDKNSDTLVLINNDDSYLNNTGKLAKNQLNYSLSNNSTITAENIKHKNISTEFIYNINKNNYINYNSCKLPLKIPIKMYLLGQHNIYNALIAITIALYYDKKPKSIQNFFKSYTGIWRRLQILYNNKFTIIDDCAHNPGSYTAVFNTIKDLNYNDLIIVNSLRGNRGVNINKENAQTISDWMPRLGNYNLYTTNCEDVVKPDDKVSPEEEKQFLNILKQKKVNYTHYQNLKPVLKQAVTTVSTDDLILLLGPHAMDEAGKMILEMI